MFLQSRGFSWSAQEVITRFTGMRSDLFVANLRESYAAILGRSPDEAELADLVSGLLETRRAQLHTMTLVAGATTAVRTAGEVFAGRIAVASSSGKAQLADKMSRFGLAGHFGPHIYSADDVERGKPYPDIFLHAAAALGVAPATTLIIEDSVNGVLAARRAGAEVWGFVGGGHCAADHARQLTESGASRIVADHEDLATQLRELS